MQCPRCQHENPPQAKFCLECGAGFAVACGQCGIQLPVGAKFCPECGKSSDSHGTEPARFASPQSYTPEHLAEKILTSKSALEGERKQVTVLFADLKGSMELLADRDPEEARKILDPVLERMMEAVHRYEGTVNQVMGDGIMALFGAPLAHEDHAVRACYAALRMQASVAQYAAGVLRPHGVPVQIRVGLNSGEVIVRSIGSDLHMDYTAVGQTTHLAARMEQMAEPGFILTTADTLRLAEGYVEVVSLGRRAVRGLAAGVDVYAVTGTGAARWPLEVALARGLTDFVGRQVELAQLTGALAAVAEGRGQVVGVVGDPGVGKSRLFHELTRPERMPGWLVLKTGAASYGKATAYRPLIDLLRGYFKIRDRDDERHIRDTIQRKVRALDEHLVPTVPAFLFLLDVPGDHPEWQSLEPRQRRQQTMEAVRRLLLRESQAQPLCLIFEDLHWIDSETQAFLDSFMESLAAARVLLLVNYRPEYRHAWGSKTYYAQLRVDPLPPRSALELLRTLLGADDRLAPLAQALIERTGGNPFFLEESVRALAEDAVLVGERGAYRLATAATAIRVPATVQTVLTARIDHLAPEDKRLLQSASVIGENVPLRLLEAVADVPEHEFHQALGRLRAAEFLYDITLFPEPEYVFRHGLTCQVAYNSLVGERRRGLHARIAQAIEQLYPGRLGEHVERLAHHALQGELWERAAGYLHQAGTKTFARSANREAAAWFEQALRVVARLPETPETQMEAIELHLGLRNALTLLGEHERILGHLHEAQRLAERLGDRRRLGRALSFEVNCLLLLAQHERAIEAGRAARAVADELGDVGLRTVADMYVGRAHLYLGEFARAIEIFGDIVAALKGPLEHDHLGVPVLPSVFARSHLVEALAEVGRFADGAGFADEALALAETTNHPDTLFWAHRAAGMHHLARGAVAEATEAFERAHQLCRIHDMASSLTRVSADLGMARALGGGATEALPMLERAVEEAATRKQTTTYSKALLLLGEVNLLAGRLDEAAEVAGRALELFRAQRERGNEAWTLRLLGDLSAREMNDAVADTQYRAAAALARQLGMRPLGARCSLGIGRLHRRAGDLRRAIDALGAAAAEFREIGMAADLARCEAELSALSSRP